MSEILDRLVATNAEAIDSYRQNNVAFRDEFLKVMGERLRKEYGRDGLVEVVCPRDPFIDSRVVVVKPHGAETQKFVLLQTFGGGYISTVDVVSLPEGTHDSIRVKYIEKLLGQEPWYFTTGGHLRWKPEGLEIFGSSGDYGSSMAGYDTNSIAAHILGMTGLFKEIKTESDPRLKRDPEQFFDNWLLMFDQSVDGESTAQESTAKFIKSACLSHKEYDSGSQAFHRLTEAYVRAANDTHSKDFIAAVLNSTYEVQREALLESILKK